MCREAGGRVRTNRLLTDLNLERDLVLERHPARAKKQERRLEVVVQGLAHNLGAQVAVDTTLVSPLKRDGTPRPKADWLDGAALQAAVRDKETTYPELLVSGRCSLLVAGHEVGGRWSEEAYDFLLQLAKAKAATAPRVLRASATVAWLRRWITLLSKTAMETLADTLLYGTADHTEHWNNYEPPLGVVLGSAAHEPPACSRLR